MKRMQCCPRDTDGDGRCPWHPHGIADKALPSLDPDLAQRIRDATCEFECQHMRYPRELHLTLADEDLVKKLLDTEFRPSGCTLFGLQLVFDATELKVA